MIIYAVYYTLIIGAYHLFKLFLFHKEEALAPMLNERSKKWKWQKAYTWIAILLMILLLGFRHPDMGWDLQAYLPIYDEIGMLSWKELLILHSYPHFEQGYVLFNKFIYNTWNHYQVLLFVCATISIIPIGYCICKNSKQPLLSIIIYMALPVFLMLFSGLRQAIAIGLTVLAFQCVRNKKLILFILVVLLASLFHKSAICFLVAYPLYYIRLPEKVLIASFFALIPIWLFSPYIFKFLTWLVRSDVEPDNNGAVNLFFIFVAIYGFCICLGNSKNKLTNGTRNLFFVACAIQALAGQYSLVIRVGYYFMIYLMLLLPEVLADMEEGKALNATLRRLARMGITAAFILCGIYMIMTTYWAEAYPYTFFWS